MTVTVRPSLEPTSFDYALGAALRAGWTPRGAFDAVCLLKASGMDEREIERLFMACTRWVQ